MSLLLMARLKRLFVDNQQQLSSIIHVVLFIYIKRLNLYSANMCVKVNVANGQFSQQN